MFFPKYFFITFNEIDYKGGVILDFASGPVYDYTLDRSIQVSSIDFDLIDENNSLNVGPNQIKFTTDIDSTYSYNEETTGEEIKIKGVLFLNDGSFTLPDISNCIFFLDTENKPNNLPSSSCIDGNKYYNLSLVFIKYKNPDIYKEISDNNFALSTVDQNGLFYCGAMMQESFNTEK